MSSLVQEFILLGCLVFFANPLVYAFFYYLLTTKNELFRELSHAKKRYVVKNLSKSVFLFFLSFCCLPYIIGALQTGHWPNNAFRKLGSVYCATDIAGLCFVPNLSTTTKLHHMVVTFCAFANILVDYQQPGIHRAMIFLAYFSMVPYLVNTLLGMRPLGFPEVKKKLAKLASVIYSLSILCNCVYQHYYVFFSSDYLILRCVYMLLYWVIFYDDLILLNYLTYSGFGYDFLPYMREKYQNIMDTFKLVSRVFQKPRSFVGSDLGNNQNSKDLNQISEDLNQDKLD